MYKNIPYHKQRFTISHIKAALFAFLIIVSVPAQAQTDIYVEIESENPTVRQVFNSVVEQTGLNFSYDQGLDLTRQLVIPKKKNALSELMEIVLKGTNRSYVVANGFVLIKGPTPPKKQQIAVERVIQSTQTLYGQVIAVGGLALYNATIEAKGEETYMTMTDIDGKFSFKNLPVGSYNISAKHPDYGVLEIETTLVKEHSKDILIALQLKGTEVNTVSVSMNRPSKDIPMPAYLQGVDPGLRYKTPRWAIKTNLLTYTTLSASLGLEVRVAKKMTLDIPISFRAWDLKDSKRFRHLIINPEIRFWGHETFNRHFFGVGLIYGIYNVGGIKLPFQWWKSLRNNRYQGQFYGVNVSVGHQWILSNRFNLEATVGVGYLYVDYKKGSCATCSDVIANGNKHYFGPTKLGLSLIYMFR